MAQERASKMAHDKMVDPWRATDRHCTRSWPPRSRPRAHGFNILIRFILKLLQVTIVLYITIQSAPRRGRVCFEGRFRAHVGLVLVFGLFIFRLSWLKIANITPSAVIMRSVVTCVTLVSSRVLTHHLSGIDKDWQGLTRINKDNKDWQGLWGLTMINKD